MQHITLDTGHVRDAPRTEVADDLMRLLVTHVAEARRRPTPIPGQPTLVAHATTARNVLLLTVSRRSRDAVAPLVSVAVVPADADVGTIWTLLRGRETQIARQPPAIAGPWCLVRIHPTIALATRDEIDRLGDYERCVAWAWIESGVSGDRPH